MAELPKSVVQRMRAEAAPQEHPDADLLAAFSEQALTGRERESVLAHLAQCAACREAVALAAPQPVAVQPGGAFVPWYRRPQIFAWAGTLATLALVGALILNFGQNRFSTPVVSDATLPMAATKPEENKPAAPPAPLGAVNGSLAAPAREEVPRRAALAKAAPEPSKKPEDKQARRDMAAPLATPAPTQAPAKDEKKLDGGVLPDQFRAMKQAPAPPPAPAAGAANVVAEREKASRATETFSVESAAAARPKSAEAATAGAAGGMLYQKSKAARASVAPEVRWSISEKGGLQRSSDGGRTWLPALANESTVFRSLAVVGMQVWAGGANAALFHSFDGGATWTKQTLPGASAAVVSLQFSDLQHGSARTSDGAAWSTSDGGLHWAKQ